MIALGIDPGTASPGIALVERLGSTWHLRESPVLHSDAEAIDWLAQERLRDIDLHCVCVEYVSWAGIRKRQGYGSGDLVQLVGAARLLARQRRIPCVEVAPSTWRKAIAGSGRAKPEDVRRALRAQVQGVPKVFGLDRSAALAIAIAGVRSPGRRVA